MGVVFLLRHGETEWSASGQHTSRTDVPLTPTGRRQARQAGKILSVLRGDAARPVAVFSSPKQRALDTAELAGLPVDNVFEDLSEWDYGEYEGLTTAHIREKVPGWTLWADAAPCPGGETAAQVSTRADGVLARIRERLVNEDVVLVGHGHFSRVLITRWVGASVREGARFGFDAGCISTLGYEHGNPQIRRLNIPASVLSS